MANWMEQGAQRMNSSFATPLLPTRSLAMKSRKLRKGTFSCWECKHRKIRCSFKSASGSICASCELRDLTCIRQNCADPDENPHEEMERRILQVESLVNQVVQQKKMSQTQPKDGKPAIGQSSRGTLNLEQPTSMVTLSGYLHSIFPSSSNINLILRYCGSLRLPVHILQFLKRPRPIAQVGLEQRDKATALPASTDHPIHFARKFAQLALCLQQLDVTVSSKPSSLQLGQPVHDVMRQYIGVVSQYVTSQDCLVNSLDGLEVLMLEAIFQMNQGSIRAAWLLFRRCIAVAQMIGLPDKIGFLEQRMWFCCIYADRTISLLLGLPFAIINDNFVNERLLSTDTPSQRLDRLHALLMGRIIARNLRLQNHGRRSCEKDWQQNEIHEYEETQRIDSEFKKAARLMESKWWSCIDIHGLSTEAEKEEKTGDLLAQMHHHYLLVILHQPYILEDCTTYNNEYSKSVIPYACREMLARFLVLRRFHVGPTYRGLEDKAFITSMALLLIHLRSHRLGPANVLEHQRPRDLILIEEIIDTMERMSALYDDNRTRSYVGLLKKLVRIEDEVANGASYGVSIENSENEATEEEHRINLPIMYFGTLCIFCQGLKSPQITDFTSDLSEDRSLEVGHSTSISGSQVQPYLLNSFDLVGYTNFDAPEMLSLTQHSIPNLDEMVDMQDLYYPTNDFSSVPM